MRSYIIVSFLRKKNNLFLKKAAIKTVINTFKKVFMAVLLRMVYKLSMNEEKFLRLSRIKR